MIAREVYIVNISHDTSLTRAVIKIIAYSGQEDANNELYKVSCPGKLDGNGNGSRALRALNQFLLDAKGQKFRIVFNYKHRVEINEPSVHMIAPVGGDIAYIRDNGILQQYDIGKNLLVRA